VVLDRVASVAESAEGAGVLGAGEVLADREERQGEVLASAKWASLGTAAS
jgi:hypothetical protein